MPFSPATLWPLSHSIRANASAHFQIPASFSAPCFLYSPTATRHPANSEPRCLYFARTPRNPSSPHPLAHPASSIRPSLLAFPPIANLAASISPAQLSIPAPAPFSAPCFLYSPVPARHPANSEPRCLYFTRTPRNPRSSHPLARPASSIRPRLLVFPPIASLAAAISLAHPRTSSSPHLLAHPASSIRPPLLVFPPIANLAASNLHTCAQAKNCSNGCASRVRWSSPPILPIVPSRSSSRNAQAASGWHCLPHPRIPRLHGRAATWR